MRLLALLSLPLLALAQGSGPYPAGIVSTPALTTQTVYRPLTLPANEQLPVFVWGNGLCLGLGKMYQSFLTEIASHGFIVISAGAENGAAFDVTTAQTLKGGIDWAFQVNATAAGEYQGKIAARVATGGTSCGGLQAVEAGTSDSRVNLIANFNSGLLSTSASQVNMLSTLSKPIFYFLGGSSDVAYTNGERDYANYIPKTLPAWKGNRNDGHLATFWETNGGEWGRATVNLLKWQLKGQTNLKSEFVGNPPAMQARGWSIVYRNL